jgi:hypothetical protein
MLKRRQNGVVPDIGLWELPAPLMAELNSFYHCLPFALHELTRLQGMAHCSSRRVRSEPHVDRVSLLWGTEDGTRLELAARHGTPDSRALYGSVSMLYRYLTEEPGMSCSGLGPMVRCR